MQARFFDASSQTCSLCSRRCHIPKNSCGFCRVRENQNGTLYAKTYGKLTACGVDPIEKKPLYHFLPGTPTLSVSSFGCNFTCLHCQNYSLSQSEPQTARVLPEDVVDAAKQSGVPSISFTYHEPTVMYEFMEDVCRLAKKEGIKTAMITNGYLTEEAVRALVPSIDAFRIDLKAFSDSFYREVCGGAHLTPVLETIELVSELKRHLELVTLIIPGLNDSSDEIDAMLSWEKETIGYSVPHHFTAFTPMYQMRDRRAATHADVDRVFKKAKEAGLYYPYVGNVMHAEGSYTYCPDCGKRIIVRAGYVTRADGVKDGYCVYCGRRIEGVFQEL